MQCLTGKELQVSKNTNTDMCCCLLYSNSVNSKSFNEVAGLVLLYKFNKRGQNYDSEAEIYIHMCVRK